MAKVKSKWVCQNCGYETVSYLGKCPECGQFSTFVEEVTSVVKKNESAQPSILISEGTHISKIKEIELDEKIRFKIKKSKVNL